ncbi:MAG: heavy-metal-associated domain-containing protein [Chitinophagales bacterium]|nr:heavy-metal-associated domain-containing protein [Chitinophagales bacterium]
METKIFHISGMCCETCITKINKALEAFPELEKVELQFSEPQLTLLHKDNVDEQAIVNAINQAGHYTKPM